MTKQDRTRTTTTAAATETTTTTPITMITMQTQTTDLTENQGLSAHSVRAVAKRITPKRNVTLKIVQQTNHHPATEDGQDRVMSKSMTHKILKVTLSRLQPTPEVTRFSFRGFD